MAEQAPPKLADRAADKVVWLTTVTPKGRPAPRPVWFVLDGEDVVLFSAPGTAKLRHLAENPQVSLNFNSAPGGGEVLVVSGTAEILPDGKPSEQAGYLDKYEADYAHIDYDRDSFDEGFGVRIRVKAERTWGF
jgi:PPOX class probable F420-dependent enzyme